MPDYLKLAVATMPDSWKRFQRPAMTMQMQPPDPVVENIADRLEVFGVMARGANPEELRMLALEHAARIVEAVIGLKGSDL